MTSISPNGFAEARLRSGGQVHVVLRMLLRLDDLGIGQQKRIVVDGRLLAAIEQFRRAQRVGIVASLKRVAQDQMAKLR